MTIKVDIVDECCNLECLASSTAVRIYNIIRQVGRGELTADNALHQLVEDYHNLKILSGKIGAIAEHLKLEVK